MSSYRHLDFDGSAPLRPEVRLAVQEALALGPPNPTGLHAASRAARRVLEEARRGLASFLGLAVPGLLFTGSGAEALATALSGLDRRRGPARSVLTSTGERPEVLEALEALESSRPGHLQAPLDQHGRLDLGAWRDLLEGPDAPDLALLHHANHATGVLQPVEGAAEACRNAGVPFILDATWSFARTALPEGAWGADAVALSCHRAGGPAGIGALWARPSLGLRPLVPGAGERGRRGGTESVALAAGLARLVALRGEGGGEEDGRVAGLRELLETRLKEAVSDLGIHGADPRLPGTSQLSFPGLEAEALALRLDLDGFGVSVGTACSAGSSRPGHVLPAMGVEPARVHAAVRFSLGWSTTREDVEALCGLLPRRVRELRRLHPSAGSGEADDGPGTAASGGAS